MSSSWSPTARSSGGATAAFYGRVVHNGAKFKVSPNANVAFFGEVTGEGGFSGDGGVFFEGTYSPGNSASWIDMSVNLQYGNENTYVAELEGYTANGPGDTEYDVIAMADSNTLSLDGTLDIDLLGGFEPTIGSTFDIFRYGSGARTGEFDTVLSPTWGAGLYFDVAYTDTAVSLQVVPEPASAFLLALACGVMALRRRR